MLLMQIPHREAVLLPLFLPLLLLLFLILVVLAFSSSFLASQQYSAPESPHPSLSAPTYPSQPPPNHLGPLPHPCRSTSALSILRPPVLPWNLFVLLATPSSPQAYLTALPPILLFFLLLLLLPYPSFPLSEVQGRGRSQIFSPC